MNTLMKRSRVGGEGVCARRAGRGFTLVEVLAVVAIIATLTGLAVPTLTGARQAGRGAACLSNLRQIGTCLTAYALDSKDLAAPGAARFDLNLQRWHGSRVRIGDAFSSAADAVGPGSSGAGGGGGGSLSVYLGDTKVRECPTFAPVLAELTSLGSGFERSCGGYGYNNVFLGVQRARDAGASGGGGGGGGGWRIVTDRAGSSLARFASPAMTIAFADGALVHDQGATWNDGGAPVVEYSFLEPRRWAETTVGGGSEWRPDPSMHFRHGARNATAGTANVCWLDGHATGTSRTATHNSGVYGDPTLPGLTGWTGERDDNGLFDYE